jgi:hypothetical protein
MSIKTPLPGLGSTSVAPGARQLPAEAKAPPALRRTVSSPALLPSSRRAAAPGGAMQSRCAKLPSTDADETEHTSRGGAAENTAALSTQTAAASLSGPSAVRTVTLSPAQVQDKAKQEALQKKRATYTRELVFNELPTGVLMQDGEPVDVKDFNLNCQVQVNGQRVECRHFAQERLRLLKEDIDPKEYLEALKSEEGIRAYFTDHPESLDDFAFCESNASAAHQASVAGSQLGVYLHDVALQLKERQAAEGGKALDAIGFKVFTLNHAMSLIVQSDFDKKTGAQYIDVVFNDPNRTVINPTIQTKNAEALGDLTTAKLLNANNEIENPHGATYQAGADLQTRLVSNDLPPLEKPLQYVPRNEIGVVEEVVFANNFKAMDNTAVNAIYDRMLDSGMSQGQMVEYLAALPMDSSTYPSLTIDSQREMVKNRMDFIEKNISSEVDAQRLITGDSSRLTFGTSIFANMPPFDEFAKCFSKSSLPTALKANILQTKNALGFTVFSKILTLKKEAVNPFLDMLKASGISGGDAAEIILAKDKSGASQFGAFIYESNSASIQNIIDRFPDLGIKSTLALDMLLVEHVPADYPEPTLPIAENADLFIKALQDPRLEIDYDQALGYMREMITQASPHSADLESLYNRALECRPEPKLAVARAALSR